MVYRRGITEPLLPDHGGKGSETTVKGYGLMGIFFFLRVFPFSEKECRLTGELLFTRLRGI